MISCTKGDDLVKGVVQECSWYESVLTFHEIVAVHFLIIILSGTSKSGAVHSCSAYRVSKGGLSIDEFTSQILCLLCIGRSLLSFHRQY
jgi:hypothetical protein